MKLMATAPVQTPADVFDDFDDEHCQNLLGSLQLDQEEPVRRGASRANSVRFDVSAIQGSGWGHGSRQSNDFGPVRPNSAFGIRSHSMERSLSHKSEGRHSSAHSVHSAHSISGRTSSLGLSNHFAIDEPEDQAYDVPQPPPGLFILGTVPTIIRCWLSQHFFHSALLYAVVCTGSQKSTVDLALLREIGLLEHIQKDAKGTSIIRLPVYLPEAIVTSPSSRPCSPGPQLPTLTVNFEVTDMDCSRKSLKKKSIRVFLGSDTLRAHSADLLLSQNVMTLYSDDRNKISIPFVRPEDDAVFKNIITTHVIKDKVSLKGTAAPFTPAGQSPAPSVTAQSFDIEPTTPGEMPRGRTPATPFGNGSDESGKAMVVEKPLSNLEPHAAPAPIQGEKPKSPGLVTKLALDTKLATNGSCSQPTTSRSQPASPNTKIKSAAKMPMSAHPDAITNPTSVTSSSIGGIWSSWRTSSTAPPPSTDDPVRTPGYNKPARGVRGMKVLKPSTSKSSTNSRSISGGAAGAPVVRTGAAYEPPPPLSMASPTLEGFGRRKSGDGAVGRWEKAGPGMRGGDGGSSLRLEGEGLGKKVTLKDLKPVAITPAVRSNPIGTASAFSWMKPGGVKSAEST